ncbi:hypothetical protein LshimejAT787_0211300 [Lyophyllum shimeji]|uniref:DUF6699 domain-containing protein n=1 Tax=Lyophyllum shimeji TaxID=47721 RepID=A0A9P3PGE1_LYOSH|nr:hypothetical protein LshimejAT787_0211300 [Lyophyllum shimeji]
MDAVNKWAAGLSYGPVLSQTDLYLLKTELELHPILLGKHSTFHLVFNILTGQTSGFNQDARDRDLAFTAKDEPATMPRVSQVIIITPHSPWCTIVKNERGVTMADICTQIWKDYTDNTVTDAEFASVPPRVQEQIRRCAMHNRNAAVSGGAWGAPYYSPAPQTGGFKRVDWLRERTFFETLQRNDNYAISRLGRRTAITAPPIIVHTLLPVRHYNNRFLPREKRAIKDGSDYQSQPRSEALHAKPYTREPNFEPTLLSSRTTL